MKPSILVATLLLLAPAAASANPAATGATGLLQVPSAETLDAGNICIGFWSDFTRNDGQTAKTLPVALTLGIGSFWEIYASYPNLLFNTDEDITGRGYASVGSKIRFFGGKGSTLKIAGDVFLNRHISMDREVNGTEDIGGRIIASVTSDRLGAHLYGGYMNPGGVAGENLQSETLFGAGIEFSPTARTRISVEAEGATAARKGDSGQLFGMFGFRYFISPHLTLNLGAGGGFQGDVPDWRFLVGFSTCQGVGSYVKTLPKPQQAPERKKEEVIKPVKIVPVSKLVLLPAAQAAPASSLEVPVDPDREEIIIKPYGQVNITPQAQPQRKPRLKIQPVQPQPPLTPVEQDLPLPLQEIISVQPAAAAIGEPEGVSPTYGLTMKGQRVEVEAARVTNAPESLRVYRKFRFPDVTFDFNQWSLSLEGKKFLADVAEQIRKDKKWIYLRVDGHTDDIGSLKYNMDLSLNRAIAVAAYLVTREGVDPEKVLIKGLGKTKPVGDNMSEEGRRLNRRSEILFLIPKEEK